MNIITVDNRGLPCPQPVIQTKKALADLTEGQVLISIVDNEIAKENVCRYATHAGCQVQIEERKASFYLTISRQFPRSTEEIIQPIATEINLGQHALFLGSNLLGSGSEELGALLIRSFFYAVANAPESLPSVIVLMNSAVYLALEDSPVKEDLLQIEQYGVDIVVCGTCLDFFQVKDRLQIGRISNMYEIYEILATRRVITL